MNTCASVTSPARKGIITAVFSTLGLLVAVLIALLVPPLQSPDESAHISRAFLLTHGQLLLENQPGESSGGWVDRGMVDYMHAFTPLILDKSTRLPPTEHTRLGSISWDSGSPVFAAIPGTGYYLPAIYTPHALGLTVGQFMGLSVENSYWLMRWFVMTCFATLIWLSCKVLPPNLLVTAVLLLPMSLFQMVSPTLDGLSAALTTLTIALFFRQIDVSREPLSWGDQAFWICLLILCCSRIHLLPLLGLQIFIWHRRRTDTQVLLTALLLLLVSAWIIWSVKVTVDTRIVRSLNTTESLMYYLLNPQEFWRVMINTLSSPEQVEFYARSFIGILGWLDVYLPSWAYPYLGAGLLACAVLSISRQKLRLDWSARLCVMLGATSSILMVFVAMLLTWTPTPADAVQGVQGRYFILPAIVMGYAFSGTEIFYNYHPMRIWLLGTFAASSISTLIFTLLQRYH